MTKYLTHKTTIQGKAETLRRREVRRVKYGTTPTLFSNPALPTNTNTERPTPWL